MSQSNYLRALLCLLGLPLSALAEGPGSDGFGSRVAPFFERYCASCHDDDEPEADLDVTALGADSVLPDRKTWIKIRDMIEKGEMPPEKRRQPSSQERQGVVSWIRSELAQFTCDGPQDPGKVTIRRLNRSEYNNTIRDLLAVDFQPARDFPADDTGYGFDNIGDVLSLPTLLMEKYLAAAEQITRRALGTSPANYLKHFEGEAFTGIEHADRVRGALRLGREAEIVGKFKAPIAGLYLLRAKVYGEFAGKELPKLRFRLDDREVKVFEVKADERAPGTYEIAVEISGGEHRFGVAYTNNYVNRDHPDPALRGDRNLIVDSFDAQLLLSGRKGEQPASYRKLLVALPKARISWTVAVRDTLSQLAHRAYRRPVSDEEVDRLVELAWQVIGDGDSFEEAIAFAAQAILASPHFLFRVESGPPTVADADRIVIEMATRESVVSVPVGDFALASRLSYFLWSSTPDEELLKLAGQGRLSERSVIEKQALRMIRDPRSRALVDNFAGQWLQTRFLASVSPDPELFPGVDEKLRRAMAGETLSFFDAIVHENRSVLELLDADYTYLNEDLAKHYGIEGVEGEEFRRVSLENSPRGGVLTQASFLTITSNPNRTSPVKRGLWILDRILGTPSPPPPPNVELLSEEPEAILSGSLRQRMERHREDPICSSCHSSMDPIGFAFENFDAVGKWREFDGKFLIDASGELPKGEKFEGAAGLKRVLMEKKDLFLVCMTEKLMTYALGRGLEYYDSCAVETIVSELKSSDYRFGTLILGIVNSEPFRRTRGGGKKS